jgi:hypothetical protein
MCGPQASHWRSVMAAILPIVILLLVYLALNKTQTGYFF